MSTFTVRILRQDLPGKQGYWNEFRVEHEPDMNVISALQKIAESPVTADGQNVAPVVWECNCLEEVCGSCTMVINGRVRQACTGLIDNLLKDNPDGIELRPMTKFPVVRDLMVDRSRLFASLERVKAWVPVDSYNDMGPGPRQSQEQQQFAYEYSKCMSCGCCLEACPQFLKVELLKRPDETGRVSRAAARGGGSGVHGGSCLRPGGPVQHEPDRRDERGRAARRFNVGRRDPGLRQRAELRKGLPQRRSAVERHRPRRPGGHTAFVEEDLRLVRF